MAQKKRRQEVASDGVVRQQHIHESQKAMVMHGPAELLARVRRFEPELGEFIACAAKEIAAMAFIDSEMPRKVAQELRERIESLAVSVYGSHYLAVYDLYKDLMKGTPAAKLSPDPEPEAAPSTPAPPPKTEEGDAGVGAK